MSSLKSLQLIMGDNDVSEATGAALASFCAKAKFPVLESLEVENSDRINSIAPLLYSLPALIALEIANLTDEVVDAVGANARETLKVLTFTETSQKVEYDAATISQLVSRKKSQGTLPSQPSQCL